MKIAAIEVDGFGVWSELRLDGLESGLNVFYGPNEAGKTTLMQFIRSVLYGFAAERRKRYLPPLRGERGGGSLAVRSRLGDYLIARHDAGENAGTSEGKLTLTTREGQPQPSDRLDDLLCHVDEATYNNVFAVGLRELQELATLSDTAAAVLLYRITAGLDRVSLAEVMHELDASRERLLARDGESCQIVALWGQRERLRGEIQDLAALSEQYAQLMGEQQHFDAEIRQLEARGDQLDNELKEVEAALRAASVWQARATAEQQLAGLGTVEGVPEGALERLESFARRRARLRRQRAEVRRRCRSLAEKARHLRRSQIVSRDATRIEAFADQHEWIASLEKQLQTLDAEVVQLEAEMAAQRQRLAGVEPGDAPTKPYPAARALKRLRPLARAVTAQRAAWRQSQSGCQQGQEAEALDKQIAAAMADRPGQDLTAALEQAGTLVAQLRRRVQLDERFEQMRRQQAELSDQNRRVQDGVVLSPWLLGTLGAVFAFGVALILAGLALPTSVTGHFGTGLAVLGLAGTIAAAASKVIIERSHERQHDRCQGQLRTLASQLKQAQEERDELDKQLPRGGGPLIVRLQAAEKELAALEELVPLDARRRSLRKEQESERERSAQAKRAYRRAQKNWRGALASAGFSEDLHPRELRLLAGSTKRLAALDRRWTLKKQERDERRRALEQVRERVAPLLLAARITPQGSSLGEQLRELRQSLQDQRQRVGRAHRLRARSRRLGQRERQLTRLIGRVRVRRQQLLRAAGAASEAVLRQRAEQLAQAQTLAHQRAGLAAEWMALIGGQHDEAAIAALLSTHDEAQLHARAQELGECRHALDAEVHGLHERRGQRAEQIKAFVADRRPGEKQLALATLDLRLGDALERWQVLAVAHRLLESVRQLYERERQPEALRSASAYLRRLTHGRYVRVWTPLSEEVLRVDDADGKTLAIELLSRGTREQLFLALRLALADSYARRGVDLPLVFDDLLVNFDAERARAAGAVLRDFAAAGHQVLVFTCHEHIQRLFRSLKVPTHRLPGNAERAVQTVSYSRATSDDVPTERRQASAVAEQKSPDKPRLETRSTARGKPQGRQQPVREHAADVHSANVEVIATQLSAPQPHPAAQAAAEQDAAYQPGYSFWGDVNGEEFAGEFAERFAQFAGPDRAGIDDPGDSGDLGQHTAEQREQPLAALRPNAPGIQGHAEPAGGRGDEQSPSDHHFPAFVDVPEGGAGLFPRPGEDDAEAA